MPELPSSQSLLQSDLANPSGLNPNLTLEYSKPLASSGIAEVAKVTTDAAGNVYTIGTIRGYVDLDPGVNSQSLNGNTSSGSMFIRKQDNNGNFVWAKKFSAIPIDLGFGLSVPELARSTDLEVDSSGNIYAIGDFGLGKWDSNGNELWFKPITNAGLGSFPINNPKISVDGGGNIYGITPGTGLVQFTMNGEVDVRLDAVNAQSLDIEVDNSGSLYSIGTFSGTVDFDPGSAVTNLDSNNGQVFVRKLNSNRELLWVRQFVINLKTSNNVSQLGLAVDRTGIYIDGSFYDTADFDPGAGVTTLQASNGETFISKLDLAGNFLWAKNFRQNYSSFTGNQTSVDINGNFYITGGFGGTIDFDPGAGVSNLTSPNQSRSNTFISKFDTNGNFVWVKQFKGNEFDKNISTGISTDRQGNIFTVGNFLFDIDLDPGNDIKFRSKGQYSDGFLSKLDSAGNFVFGQQFSSDFGRWGAVAFDDRGGVYVGGGFFGSSDFAIGQQQQISSIGQSDAYIARLNRVGQVEWVKTFGGLGKDGILNLQVDRDGTISTFGRFRGTIDFDPGNGVFNLTSRSTEDGFVAKFDVSGNFIEAKLQDIPELILPTEMSDRFGYRYLFQRTLSTVSVEKRNRNNERIWVQDFNQGAYDGRVDRDGNLYITRWEPLGDRILWLDKYTQPKPKTEIFWHNDRNGYSSFWQINNGTEFVGTTTLTYGPNFGSSLTGQPVYLPPGWKLVGTADFNKDGVKDHLYQNGQFISIWYLGADANNQTSYLIGAAPPTFAGQPVSFIDPNWQIVGLGDMNQDGYADLVFQNALADYVGVWYMQANNQILGQALITNAASSGFTAGAATRTGNTNWKVIGVGDFDGDGEMELMFRLATLNAVSIWKLKNGQFLGAIGLPTLASGFESRGIGDFNGDGIADAVWRDRSSGSVYIWTMNRQTAATQTVLVNGGGNSGWEIAAIGDMNFDGTDDLIWHNNQADQVAVWLLKNAQYSAGNFIRNFRPGGNQAIQQTGDRAWKIEAVNDFA